MSAHFIISRHRYEQRSGDYNDDPWRVVVPYHERKDILLPIRNEGQRRRTRKYQTHQHRKYRLRNKYSKRQYYTRNQLFGSTLKTKFYRVLKALRPRYDMLYK